MSVKLSEQQLTKMLDALGVMKNAVRTLTEDHDWADQKPHPAIGQRGYGREFATMVAKSRLDFNDLKKIREAIDSLTDNPVQSREPPPATRTPERSSSASIRNESVSPPSASSPPRPITSPAPSRTPSIQQRTAPIAPKTIHPQSSGPPLKKIPIMHRTK